MALGCNCDAGLSNTGRPNCLPLQSVTSKLIMVPLQDNAGALNGIDLTLPLPNWTSLVNEVDASKRWFPLPVFENVELPKADSVFEEANSGRMAFLRQGKRSFAGELWAYDATPQFLGKLASGRCVEFGVYIVDINGSIVGSKVGDTLYPIPVDNQSFDPKFMFATDSAVQKIMLGFDFLRSFDESSMWMITASEAIDFNTLEGLLDVVMTEVTSSVTGVTINASFAYGTALNPLKFKGAILADFALKNAATGAPVTISASSEPVDGQYVLLATLSVGTSYVLSVTKTGFSGSLTFTA
jgi:hypothetical protein